MPLFVPYFKGTSEKTRCIGNHFNFRTIFKTENALRGALMKTGLVRDAQQTKQCVYNIPCDCGRCSNSETRRHLDVRIKEHKYNLTQNLLEKSKLAQRAYEVGHKICWSEQRSCILSPTPHTGNTRNKSTCLCWTIQSVNPVWTYLPPGPPLSQQKSRNYDSIKCSLSVKICFSCVGPIRSIASPVIISIILLLRCKASYAWSFNNLMFS
jgi:hypothetical protein